MTRAAAPACAQPSLYMPIAQAMICCSCDCVSQLAERCPACSSEEVISLARVLNRERIA